MPELLLCGIDEAGRGPLAGPLVIAGVVLNESIEGLTDSKKLSEKRREALYAQIVASSQYHVVLFSHEDIDTFGISKCLHDGLEDILSSLPAERYLFDGNSTFGVDTIATMVKADLKVAEVSAASIIAKVTRDRMMYAYDLEYPEYGFKSHKGYGTARHVAAIKEFGRSTIHRKSFKIKSLDEPTLF